MKDTQIHEGLENETLREVISIGLLKSHSDKYPDKPMQMYPKGDKIGTILWSIEQKREDIKKKEFEIEKQVRQLAYITLMEDKGWIEHDTSDYLAKTGVWFKSFIGTEEEYDNLIKKIQFD